MNRARRPLPTVGVVFVTLILTGWCQLLPSADQDRRYLPRWRSSASDHDTVSKRRIGGGDHLRRRALSTRLRELTKVNIKARCRRTVGAGNTHCCTKCSWCGGTSVWTSSPSIMAYTTPPASIEEPVPSVLVNVCRRGVIAASHRRIDNIRKLVLGGRTTWQRSRPREHDCVGGRNAANTKTGLASLRGQCHTCNIQPGGDIADITDQRTVTTKLNAD